MNAKEKIQLLETQKNALLFIAGQTGLESFEYCPKTQSARFISTHTLFDENLTDEQGLCTDFPERLIREGIVCPEYAQAFKNAFQTILSDEGKSVLELQMRSRQNTRIWIRFILVLNHECAGADTAFGVFENITREKKVLQDYLNETQFYQIILSDQDAYAQVDVTADQITRAGGMWNLYNELINKITYSQLVTEFIYKVVHPDDRAHYLEVMKRDNFIKSFDNGIDRLSCQFRRIVEQNKMMWMQLSVHLLRDPISRHVFALLYIKNIDAQKKKELLLLRDSTIDQLTNIYNKKVVKKVVSDQLKQMTADEICAFMVLDMDDFKQINDTYGHKAGDQALVQAADIISRAFRKSDIIGRFGGDEFVIFLRTVTSQAWVCDRLKSLYQQFSAVQNPAPLSCSVGITLSHKTDSYEKIFQQADSALYKAKSEGKGRFVFYGNQNVETKSGLSDAQNFTENIQKNGRQNSAADVVFEAKQEGFADDESTDFDSFVSAQGDIAYLVDTDTFDLICGNRAFYDRLGITESQCARMKCYEAMQKRTSPCPFCSKANWTTDKFFLWKNRNLALEQEFLIKNKLVHWQGQEVLLALAIDISNNKSIVDSMENGATESHDILSGIQKMNDAQTLTESMSGALEIIGNFFRADTVRFWRRQVFSDGYECEYLWKENSTESVDDDRKDAVNSWFEQRVWKESIVLENPEAMLHHSYELYQYMKDQQIKNQRWFFIHEKNREYGCLQIDSISVNFQNVSFLSSFSVFIAAEIKNRRLMEETMHAARYDRLTNLLNRHSFEQYLAAYNPDEVFASGVIMANFNNMTAVNNEYGFDVGNYYIRQFADMLRAVFTDDSVFRINGDEFLVISINSERNKFESDVTKLKMLADECDSFSVSIGRAWDNYANNLSQLIQQATLDMKENKNRHNNTADISNSPRQQILDCLVNSLENGEFEVFLQPKVELSSRKVSGAEALIRYHHPTMGIIPPAHFIEDLEQNNLIEYVDLFVLEQICKWQEIWKQQGIPIPVVSLNFSQYTLQITDILPRLEALVSQYDVKKSNLEIEINENVVDLDKRAVYQTTRELSKAGYSISLDDFDTNRTNLAILADVDFAVLKLDKSMIGALKNQSKFHVILKNVIQMCRDMDIGVIAEGIETAEQETILRDLDCRYGQGYLYGKPMPLGEFEALCL